MMPKLGTLKKTDQKYLANFEMCYWRRVEISWTNHVRSEEVLPRVKEDRNILHTIRRTKANWIGHILHINYLLKNVIAGKIEGEAEVIGKREGRRTQLLDDLKERKDTEN
jgi:hypothetical protein